MYVDAIKHDTNLANDKCVCRIIMFLVCAAGRRIHGYVRNDEQHDGEHGK